MAKAILMSIKPEWVAKILNGEKTIEIRKRFPKDYVGWVYIYCTKGKPYLSRINDDSFEITEIEKPYCEEHYVKDYNTQNGKVVARFWCGRVEDFGSKYAFAYKDKHFYEILEKACISTNELSKYKKCTVQDYEKGKANLYAIHISKLEIFDEPKEISEFGKCELLGCCDYQKCNNCRHHIKLTKAPQSWCWVEV